MIKSAYKPPKVFRDPVHNLIAFDGCEWEEIFRSIIEAPEFQRLRRIRQLGLSAFTFHGAEHSRFTHSLGVYEVAKQMLVSLETQQGEFRRLFRPLKQKRLEIFVAALLHDIGHAPFSHILEKIFIPEPVPRNYPRDHEDWTKRIIRGRLANGSLRDSLDWNFVLTLYDKEGANEGSARDIISSQLDADRLDYLLRDSHAAGVPYGRFDLAWLLHSIRIGLVELPGVTGKMPRLCFQTPKARAIVEQYVQARQCMFMQVYTHKTTRAYEALLRHIFELACYIIKQGGHLPDSTPEPLVKVVMQRRLMLKEYLSLDDFVIWNVLRVWAKAFRGSGGATNLLAKKADALINRRKPYRTIYLSNNELRDAALEVITKLKDDNGLEQFSCFRDTYEEAPYRNILYEKSKDEEEKHVRPIYLLDNKGKTHLAEEDSPVIRKLSEVPMQISRLHYDDEVAGVVRLLHEKKLI